MGAESPSHGDSPTEDGRVLKHGAAAQAIRKV
jgi:hypothetical protein